MTSVYEIPLEKMSDFLTHDSCANCCGSLANCTRGIQVGDKIKPFCDVACRRQYERDKFRPILERDLQQFQLLFQHCPRYAFSKTLFYKSLLARKPRAEIERLLQLYKKICGELCEEAMEKEIGNLAFHYGEKFKGANSDYDVLIECFSAPNPH